MRTIIEIRLEANAPDNWINNDGETSDTPDSRAEDIADLLDDNLRKTWPGFRVTASNVDVSVSNG